MNKNEKEDKQFLINLSLSNRDSLINVANILISICLAFSAFIISIYSIYVSVVGANKNSLIVGLICLTTITPYWIWSLREYKKNVRNAGNFNLQYQNYLFKVYPELKNKRFYH